MYPRYNPGIPFKPTQTVHKQCIPYSPGIPFKPTQTVHKQCTLDITQVYNLNLLRLYIHNVPHTQCIYIYYIEYRPFHETLPRFSVFGQLDLGKVL